MDRFTAHLIGKTMKLKTTNYTSPVKKIKSKFAPNKELGIGCPDNMECAQLQQVINSRDMWLMEIYGIRKY